MNRWWTGVAVACLIVGVGLAPMAWANTVATTGQAVQIGGIDDAAATGWSYMTGMPLKLLSGGAIATGLLRLAGGYPGQAVLAGGAGVGGAFLSRTVDSAYTAAAAATGLLQGLPSALQAFLDGFTGVRLVHDPVFWLALALVLLCLHGLRQHRLGL